MLRLLAILLLGLVLTADGAPVAFVTGLAELAGVEAGGDCCPDRPGDAEDEGDCCDVDFGRCCATGIVGLAPGDPPVQARRSGAALPTRPLSPDLLRPRTTGPPPTPPPIA